MAEEMSRPLRSQTRTMERGDFDMASLNRSHWKPAELETALIKGMTKDATEPHTPYYTHNYVSDDELASPIDDSQSLTSDSASLFSLDSLTDSSLSQACEGDCIRATTVTFMPVGKPKVISVPPSPTSPRMDRRSPRQREFLLLESDPLPELSSSEDEREDKTPPMTFEHGVFPSAIPPRTSSFYQRRPSLPAHLISTHDFQSQPTEPVPSVNQASESFEPKARAGSISRPSTPLASTAGQAMSHMRKLSTAPLFSRIGQSFKPKITRENISRPLPENQATTFNATAPLASFRPQGRGKMVARGANERTPTITLPPCPDGYEAEVDLADSFVARRRQRVETEPAMRRLMDQRRVSFPVRFEDNYI